MLATTRLHAALRPPYIDQQTTLPLQGTMVPEQVFSQGQFVGYRWRPEPGHRERPYAPAVRHCMGGLTFFKLARRLLDMAETQQQSQKT
jgi:hypothetical protein